MLFQLRKENIELNDEYNKMFKEKTRLETQYQIMNEQIEELEIEKESEKHE
jgi:predicted nuclease with TOPRIM domain